MDSNMVGFLVGLKDKMSRRHSWNEGGQKVRPWEVQTENCHFSAGQGHRVLSKEVRHDQLRTLEREANYIEET